MALSEVGHAATRGILAIWHDVAPGAEAGVIDWYNREHHFERLAVPGFQSVRRYHALDAGVKLFIRYETQSLAVLDSAAYLARLNSPTPWTRQSQSQFRNNSRTVCARRGAKPAALGGFVLTLRVYAGAALDLTDHQAWAGWASEQATQPCILDVECWAPDFDRSAIPTREKEIRKEQDDYVSAVAVVHGSDPDALAALMHRGGWPWMGEGRVEAGLYQLQFDAVSGNMS
jgi:hypothetical protein